MKSDRRTRRRITAAVLFALGWSSLPVHAQDSILAGDKTIYSSSSTVSGYHDYVDASVFVTNKACSSADVCCAINQGLLQISNNSIYATKGLVDARGIFPATGGNFSSCTTYPWVTSVVGATVLLPAGTIPIPAPWELPANTRLVGEGSGIATGTGVTTIQAASGFAGDMIDMGDPSGQTTLCSGNCGGIVIEHLRLDASASSAIANGILNSAAQEFNFVNDVAIIGMPANGTGLTILGKNDTITPGSADNSGPYSNIYFSGSGTCVNINGTYGTRGIHGLTCNNTAGSVSGAIKVDGTNNTIQDVYIAGYKGDGIVIGSQGTYAQDNLIFNVTGDTNVKNLVHVANSLGAQPDITLMGIKSAANTTIQDDVTNSKLTERTVGLYILGEQVAGGTSAYSRFTTSSTYPAWFVGPAPGTGTCTGTGGTVIGSLYSVVSGTAGPTLWACVGTPGSGTWQSLSSH